jgi:hypothetical protein
MDDFVDDVPINQSHMGYKRHTEQSGNERGDEYVHDESANPHSFSLIEVRRYLAL